MNFGQRMAELRKGKKHKQSQAEKRKRGTAKKQVATRRKANKVATKKQPKPRKRTNKRGGTMATKKKKAIARRPGTTVAQKKLAAAMARARGAAARVRQEAAQEMQTLTGGATGFGLGFVEGKTDEKGKPWIEIPHVPSWCGLSGIVAVVTYIGSKFTAQTSTLGKVARGVCGGALSSTLYKAGLAVAAETNKKTTSGVSGSF